MAVEVWLNGLKLAPKTRSHIKQLLHVIFQCAMRRELIARNPIGLVRVKGGSKRKARPRILEVQEFGRLMAAINEPYRTMVMIAGSLGLRISEIMGLQYSDFDFENSTVLVQRGVVHGRVGDVKTEYSKDHLPLDSLLVEKLQEHRKLCYPTTEGWLFANPATGKPYHQEQIQKNHLTKAATTAEITGRVGWHSFRHSYRTWLQESGAPLAVQQELMRHASITTTMNVYGKDMTDTKRQANSKVVQMVLREPKPTLEQPKMAVGA
jgi:integrase